MTDLSHPAPQFSPDDAERLAKDIFGVEGTASPLDSERDRNYRIKTETDAGWIWAHAYRFEEGASTFILECSEETWRGLGFDRMDAEQTCRAGERIFAKYLDGHRLESNARHLRGSA